MKTNELRIGNLVKDLDGYLCKIASGDQIDWTWEAIPLTKEWLLKFGFKHNRYYDMYNIRIHNNVPLWVTIIDGVGRVSITTNPIKLADINYVHQLQNLYFALTGKELKINE